MAEATSTVRANAKAYIESMGLGELWEIVDQYLMDGWEDGEKILKAIQMDPEYNERLYKRFPGMKLIEEENKKRVRAGMPPMAVPAAAEYVALEQGYAAVTRGIPGEWATPDNIAKWISEGVSVQQVDDRIAVAENYINYDVNPEVRQELRDIYGLTDMEMVSYVLSDETNQQRLSNQWDKRMRQANVGAAARINKIGITGSLRDEVASGSDSSYTVGQASAMFRNIAEQAESYRNLGAISGVDTSDEELIRDEFNLAGGTQAAKKKKRLASQERARFSKSSGLSRGSLSRGGLGSQ